MTDFYKPTKNVSITKANETSSRERAVRLYCVQNGREWALQIRGPIGLGLAGHREGKDFIIASLSLSPDELVELRSMIEAAIHD